MRRFKCLYSNYKSCQMNNFYGCLKTKSTQTCFTFYFVLSSSYWPKMSTDRRLTNKLRVVYIAEVVTSLTLQLTIPGSYRGYTQKREYTHTNIDIKLIVASPVVQIYWESDRKLKNYSQHWDYINRVLNNSDMSSLPYPTNISRWG